MKAPHSQKEPGKETRNFSEKLRDALALSASKGRQTRTTYSLEALAGMIPKPTSSHCAGRTTEKSTEGLKHSQSITRRLEPGEKE